MKKLLTATVISALGLASGAALARPYGEMGRVIEARPVYESVATTTQQCWTQPVTRVETQYVPQTTGAGATSVNRLRAITCADGMRRTVSMLFNTGAGTARRTARRSTSRSGSTMRPTATGCERRNTRP